MHQEAERELQAREQEEVEEVDQAQAAQAAKPWGAVRRGCGPEGGLRDPPSPTPQGPLLTDSSGRVWAPRHGGEAEQGQGAEQVRGGPEPQGDRGRLRGTALRAC